MFSGRPIGPDKMETAVKVVGEDGEFINESEGFPRREDADAKDAGDGSESKGKASGGNWNISRAEGSEKMCPKLQHTRTPFLSALELQKLGSRKVYV